MGDESTMASSHRVYPGLAVGLPLAAALAACPPAVIDAQPSPPV